MLELPDHFSSLAPPKRRKAGLAMPDYPTAAIPESMKSEVSETDSDEDNSDLAS